MNNNMSEEGDIDVESAEDVPDIAVEATATTVEDRSDVYSPTVSYGFCVCMCLFICMLYLHCTCILAHVDVHIKY